MFESSNINQKIMKKLTLVFTILFALSSYAQQKSFKISGKVTAEDTKEVLESATVYLERVKDSSLVTYTITDKDGKFFLEDKTYDDALRMHISYVGYTAYSKDISIDKENIDLGDIVLNVDNNSLDEVIIRSRAPITVKKDTLEFNVSSFKTKKDANVEDLLKKLPGVEVDAEGAITVNGKPVNKILVNGKPFFGDDPTITTRNLTKEIIDKVQITDTKTKAEAFSGEKGDDQNKTINLTIKEENNKGVFGRVAGGAGTDDRNEFAGILNIFDNDRRISILAGGNNINSPNFSFGEIERMLGGISSVSIGSGGSLLSVNGLSFGGGGQGIITSRNGGANYADVIFKGLDVSADYFYSESSSDNESRTERENILPDRSFFTNSESTNFSDNQSHRFNTELDIKIDSTFLLNIRPSFNYGRTERSNTGFSESFDENNVLTNQSTSSSISEGETRNFSNRIDLTKRFGSNGRFLKFGLTTTFNTSQGENFQRSEALFEDPNVPDIIRDQFIDDDRETTTISANATYRIPIIAKELFLDAKLSYRSNKDNSVNSNFDFNDATQQYDLFNTLLSSDFEYINNRFTPSIDLTYRKEKFTISGEVGYVFRTIENDDTLRPELNDKRRFEAVELGGNFSYRFNNKASLYSGYTLSNRPPNLNQLQAFQNVANPLNIITGNPDLEPTNDHSLYVGFNKFDFQKGTGINGFISGGITQNQIITRTIVDENFVRNTTYDNVNGNVRVNANIRFNKNVKVDSLRTLKVNTGISAGLNRTINFNNDVRYASVNRNLSPSLGLTFTWKDVLELRPNYRLSFTSTRFNVDDFENQEFLTHNLRLRTTTYLPKKFEWRNDINYNFNPQVAPGFQRSSWFWNSTLAYSFLRDKATLTLKVYDLLNQNTNARRVSTADFVQDSQSTVLQQYFLLSFSWKFNSLGSKGETKPSTSFFVID